MSPDYSLASEDPHPKMGVSTRRPSMARHKILVVDDEDLIRWSIRQKLTKWGYSSVEADSCASAGVVFEREPCDLILLDVRLPDGSGLDFLRHVRESSPETVVVMMTAYGVLAGGVALDDIIALRDDMDEGVAGTAYGAGVKARDLPMLKMISAGLLGLIGLAEVLAILI